MPSQQALPSSDSTPLQLMPIPESPWESHSLDFITNLRKTKGYDPFLVIVCYISKMAHFIPTHTTADAVKIAELFIENIFRLHGLPKIIISDRDPKFPSKFRKFLIKTLETQLKVSTAFHSETDVQTEKLNQTLEIMLGHYVDDRPTTWTNYLPIIEFAYNRLSTPRPGAHPSHWSMAKTMTLPLS